MIGACLAIAVTQQPGRVTVFPAQHDSPLPQSNRRLDLNCTLMLEVAEALIQWCPKPHKDRAPAL